MLLLLFFKDFLGLNAFNVPLKFHFLYAFKNYYQTKVSMIENFLFKYWTEHGIGFNYATCNVLFFNHNFSVSQSDRLSALLPDETKQHLDSVLPKNQFEIAYRLDCRNLCADFQEDIQFRFSFGITALMERFLGRKGVKTVLTGKGNTVSFCKVFVVMLFSSLKKKSLALSSLNRICLTKKKKISMKVIELI